LRETHTSSTASGPPSPQGEGFWLRLKNAVAAFARINADMKSGVLNESDALLLAIYKSF